MKITIAKTSGFCIGVEKAFQRIIVELDKPVTNQIYGELIHNPQVTELLAHKGLKTVHDIDQISTDPVIVRTHGVPRNELAALKKISPSVVNLTCSRVSHVQGIIKKHAAQNYFAIILGDANHAEVKGLVSYASAGHMLISSPEEIPPRLDPKKKYIVVSQTTFDRNLFETITCRLLELNRELLVFNTICSSTHNRQSEVQNLLGQGVDLLIVIGGRHSSNTKRLADIGRSNNVETLHVETADELPVDEIRSAKHILVTAGASTPSWIVDEVLDVLYMHTGLLGKFSFLIKLGRILSESGFIGALAAAIPLSLLTHKPWLVTPVFLSMSMFLGSIHYQHAQQRSLVYKSVKPLFSSIKGFFLFGLLGISGVILSAAKYNSWLLPSLFVILMSLSIALLRPVTRARRSGIIDILEIITPLIAFLFFFKGLGLESVKFVTLTLLCGLFTALRQISLQHVFYSTNRITAAAGRAVPAISAIIFSVICLAALSVSVYTGNYSSQYFIPAGIHILIASLILMIFRGVMYRPILLSQTAVDFAFLIAALSVFFLR